MSIRVEFYGIARQRAGVEFLELEGNTLGEVFDRLQTQLPEFSAACLKEGELLPGFLANVNGQTFSSKRDTPLNEGDDVLILSADAGG
ncbi:MAG: MoaD/ThiS family protein [Planctomycetaceae bacterium]|jgi:molybdopterin converting factor small subunit|nr:MoaD/ThiS family protein [Planctomycetaceae bacterium]MBT6484144.1 MoaD/ThiS family protein [Planctomycetaceae bacterium]MBT6497990.1 MoaD/ThiS family protein [Planctomycetaceae bacterium]